MEPVLINIGANWWDLGDLVPDRLRIVPLKGRTAAQALRRLDLESPTDLVGQDECSGMPLVAGLAPPLPTGRGGRRPTFDLHVK